MEKVVCFINSAKNLSVFPFLKETLKKYKYLVGHNWSFSLKKEDIIYVGEETKNLKKLKREFADTLKEIEAIKEKQKNIVLNLTKLSTNENKLYDIDNDKILNRE